MGYAHINNLYKDQRILAFRECYALEKVHGTSAHVGWDSDRQTPLDFYAGGEKHISFVNLFHTDVLTDGFTTIGQTKIVVHGEAYGGKQQGMRHTYGSELSFIVFDVRIGEHWLSVPDATQITTQLGLEFVPFNKVSTDIPVLDAERDMDSIVAVRRGMGEGKKREGVILRPPFEVSLNNGERLCAKHKREDFQETNTPRKVLDPTLLKVLTDASAIAQEWVTEMRLTHVLDKLVGMMNHQPGMSDIPTILRAMVEDIEREATGEIVASKDARKAISARTAIMFKKRLQAALY